MSDPATLSQDRPFIEVRARTAVCLVPNCGGAVVRHSLGAGQAVDRCSRCFRRYRVALAAPQPTSPSKLRRWLDDFVSWRE
jgi:hypothetical protein